MSDDVPARAGTVGEAGVRRIAILSSASGGGAGIAARRIWAGLSRTPGNLVDFVDIATLGETLPPVAVVPSSSSRRGRTDTHYTGEFPGFVRGWMTSLLAGYDLINVHWASFLVSTTELLEVARAGRPMLVTMHDYYYLTGGCHYPAGCTGQAEGCVGCPQVNEAVFPRSSVMAAFREKKELFSLPNVHVSAPSRHLVDAAVASGFVPSSRAHVIRNIFEPVLGMPGSDAPDRRKHVLLIAASLVERRKGTMLALAALAEASTHVEGMVVHLVGQMDSAIQQVCRDANLKVVDHGKISDERHLAEIYRQVGVILSASLEDNWPNVLVEAGSYGVVPVVGSGHGCEEFCRVFDVGEVVDRYTPLAFAEGIRNCIEQYPDPARLSRYAQAVRRSSSTEEVVRSYFQVVDGIGIGHEVAAVPAPAVEAISDNYLSSLGRLRGLQDLRGVPTGPFSPDSQAYTGFGFIQYLSGSADR